MWGLGSRNNKKEPDWISKVSFTGDQETMRALIKAGAVLENPREMIFCVYADEENSEKIKKEAEAINWDCTPAKSADPNAGELTHYLELKRNGYILGLDRFEQDKQTIQALANKYHGHYDGWYASV
jgi:hypothetical protein